MIDRELIEGMFADIRSRGKWDMDGPMLWGFFFTDEEREKLEAAAKKLVDGGYTFVDIFLAEESGDEDTDLWFLHVERVEHLTVDTLDNRNRELSTFASKHGLRSYDGMDVGPRN